MSFEKEIKQYHPLDKLACKKVGVDPIIHVDLKAAYSWCGLDENDYDEAVSQINRHVDNVRGADLMFREERVIGNLSGHEYSSYTAMLEGEAVYWATKGEVQLDSSNYHIRYMRGASETIWTSNYYASWDDVISHAFKDHHFQIDKPAQFTAEQLERVNHVRAFREHLMNLQDVI